MPNRTLYNLTAGTFTVIRSTQPSRRVEYSEDSSGTRSGLSIKFIDDNYAVTNNYPPDAEPIIQGEVVSAGGGFGAIVGMGPQTGLAAAPGTILAYATALSGSTVLRVTETE